METCLSALIFFVLRNPKHQLLILQNEIFREVISTLITEKNERILKFLYLLLNELYAENYSVVLNFNQDYNKNILKRLTQKVNDYLKILSDDV